MIQENFLLITIVSKRCYNELENIQNEYDEYKKGFSYYYRFRKML